MIVKGKAHVYGDNIDTDRIIPGKYTKTLDLSTLAIHVMEDLDPEFHKKFQKGDILVAGENFGCGSSREQAPLALKEAGVSLVIARFFARIFFRNAINIGLPVLELPGHSIRHGDMITADLSNGGIVIESEDGNTSYRAEQIPQVMIDILSEGGLENYLKKKKDYKM